MLNPSTIAELLRTSHRQQNEDIEAFWVESQGSRQGLVSELQALTNDLPILITTVGRNRFIDPDGIIDDLSLTILDNKDWFTPERRRLVIRDQKFCVVLVSKRSLGVPQLSSPVSLPDWFPVWPSRLLTANITSIYSSKTLIEKVASVIALFRTMNPADQARALKEQTDPFEALITDYVRAAADAVVSLVPMMKGVQIDAIEDDLTAFIQHLLAARVHFLGWSVGDQSKGGFSAKGNPGERDLLVTWGASVLALIEAVICDKPLTQDAMKADLESHFQKLLGYGSPRIFFHLTYAYIEEKQALMQFLERSAETVSPPGFADLGREPIAHEDSRPPGFVARYSADFGEVKVVFLILNMGQQRQRDAAKSAAATKARKAPPAVRGC